MGFVDSQTKENLMRAFAGECQARMRYTFAASAAKKQKLPVIEAVFSYTAGQEKEHAEIFYNYLQALSGQTVTVSEAGYPVDTGNEIATLLRAAEHNEYEEHDVVYPAFGDTAEAEGFPDIAQSFRQIADIEQTHGNRFRALAQALEQQKLFVADTQTGWVCLNCGHIHEGLQAPDVCPVCHHEQGYFIRVTFAPYQGGNG